MTVDRFETERTWNNRFFRRGRPLIPGRILTPLRVSSLGAAGSPPIRSVLCRWRGEQSRKGRHTASPGRKAGVGPLPYQGAPAGATQSVANKPARNPSRTTLCRPCRGCCRQRQFLPRLLPSLRFPRTPEEEVEHPPIRSDTRANPVAEPRCAPWLSPQRKGLTDGISISH